MLGEKTITAGYKTGLKNKMAGNCQDCWSFLKRCQRYKYVAVNSFPRHKCGDRRLIVLHVINKRHL